METSINVIIGDLLEYYFVTTSIDMKAVRSMCFTCKSQGICVHLPYSKIHKGFCLRLKGDVTSEFCAGTHYYDLTAELINGSMVTLIYNGIFTVYKKSNILCEEHSV